jgi:hypothetical protein
MDFVFSPKATKDDFRAGGYAWQLNWTASRPTARTIEAARLAINAANEAAAATARTTHPWSDRSYQTEDSVFVRPAFYNIRLNHMFGSWGVRDIPREPPRMNEPANPEYEERYGGRLLTTKDVALLLEFGFTTQIGWGANRREGKFVEFPWLYDAWDAEKRTVLPLMTSEYKNLPPRFQYRIANLFASIEQVYGGRAPNEFTTE